MAVVAVGADVLTMDVAIVRDRVHVVAPTVPGAAMDTVMVISMDMDMATVMLMVMDMVMDMDIVTVVMDTAVMARITLVLITLDLIRLDRISSWLAALAAARGPCGNHRSFFGTAACRGPWRRARHHAEIHRDLSPARCHEADDTVTVTDTDTDTDMATRVDTMRVD